MQIEAHPTRRTDHRGDSRSRISAICSRIYQSPGRWTDGLRVQTCALSCLTEPIRQQFIR